MSQDLIDELMEQWRRERPELDPSAMGVVGRVLRLAGYLERSVEVALKPFGLSLWQFDVLATLRRAGKPYRLSPTQLMRAVMLSSGAMTNRLDRLETAGLVKREPDPNDRRGVLITLTPKGRQLADEAIQARFEEARARIASLSKSERRALERGLRRLLESVEGSA
jgi:DNA-binding MarR family transcriptional regulator